MLRVSVAHVRGQADLRNDSRTFKATVGPTILMCDDVRGIGKQPSYDRLFHVRTPLLEKSVERFVTGDTTVRSAPAPQIVEHYGR